jgi:hypothetical protein
VAHSLSLVRAFHPEDGVTLAMLADRSAAEVTGGNDFDRAAEPVAGKRTQAPVKRRQHALSFVCQSQEIGIRELLGALQLCLHSLHGRRPLKAAGPEFVSRVRKIVAEQ